MTVGAMSGTRSPDARRKNKNYGKGRVCSEENCEQVLSQYNTRTECYQHHKFKHARNRGWIDPSKKKS